MRYPAPTQPNASLPLPTKPTTTTCPNKTLRNSSHNTLYKVLSQNIFISTILAYYSSDNLFVFPIINRTYSPTTTIILPWFNSFLIVGTGYNFSYLPMYSEHYSTLYSMALPTLPSMSPIHSPPYSNYLYPFTLIK